MAIGSHAPRRSRHSSPRCGWPLNPDSRLGGRDESNPTCGSVLREIIGNPFRPVAVDPVVAHIHGHAGRGDLRRPRFGPPADPRRRPPGRRLRPRRDAGPLPRRRPARPRLLGRRSAARALVGPAVPAAGKTAGTAGRAYSAGSFTARVPSGAQTDAGHAVRSAASTFTGKSSTKHTRRLRLREPPAVREELRVRLPGPGVVRHHDVIEVRQHARIVSRIAEEMGLVRVRRQDQPVVALQPGKDAVLRVPPEDVRIERRGIVRRCR